MTTLIDFSSLFQLAFGTGIGLSFFQAPVRLRLDPLLKSIANELLLLKDTPDVNMQRGVVLLQSLQIDALVARAKLEKNQNKPLIMSLICAGLNLLLLIWASLDAQRDVSVMAELVFLLVSVAWFAGVLIWIEVLALDHLGPIISEYRKQ